MPDIINPEQDNFYINDNSFKVLHDAGVEINKEQYTIKQN